MPLYISININDKPIEELRIGRLETLKGEDKSHTYLIQDENGNAATFRHVYKDGARVCLEKGLQALREVTE